MAHRTCFARGCSDPITYRRWCMPHYEQWFRYGLPENDPIQLQLAKIVVGADNECWVWTAGLNENGYGNLAFRGQHYLAHRWAYEWWVGPIPPGMSLDHLCRNRRCCNPAHLEPVTPQENMRRARGMNYRPACGRGHLYTPENTGWLPYRRYCRACHRIHESKRVRKSRAVAKDAKVA